jgi:hypothetical protein
VGLYDATGPETRGALRQPLAELLARPYVERAVGRIGALGFDRTSRVLTVMLDGSDKAAADPDATIVLSVPRVTYPSGARVLCDGQKVEAAGVAHRSSRLAVRCAGTELRVEPR